MISYLVCFRMLDSDDEQSAATSAVQNPSTVLLNEQEPSEDNTSERFDTYFSDQKVQIPERVSSWSY